jgi:DNA helicase-2/ATP-dependent DNA helicase PcrA
MGNVRTMMWENYEDNNAQSRMDNLERLVESCISEDFTREDFVDAFVTEKMEEKHPELAITLSTIHSAKGLEWETVFLVGAGDTQMPGRRAIERHEIEEERRLMYVAVTRAKGNLGISFPGVLGEGWYGGDAQGVSRFLQ